MRNSLQSAISIPETEKSGRVNLFGIIFFLRSLKPPQRCFNGWQTIPSERSPVLFVKGTLRSRQKAKLRQSDISMLIILHRRLINGVFSSIRREVFAIPWSNENSLLSFKQFLVGLPVPPESLDIRNSGWPRFRGLKTFNFPWWSRIDQIKNLHIILHFYLTNAPAEEEAEDRVKTFPSKARKSKGGEEELGCFMLVPFYKSHETTSLNFKLQDAKNLRRRINY